MIGIYRTLLALGVVFYHFPVFLFPLPEVYGRVLVSAFFIISGYLITLTLNRNYSSPIPFYWNRFIRIYPLHLTIVIAGTILIVLGMYKSPISINQFVEALYFNVRHYENVNDPTWTLGIEIIFYLAAPFLVYSARRMILATLLSVLVLAWNGKLMLMFGAYNIDPHSEQWSIMLSLAFPLFMLGGLLYKLPFRLPNLQLVATLGLLSSVFLLDSFVLVFLSTVVLLLSRGKEFDVSKQIGDLCYPIYMIHYVAIFTVGGWVSIPITVGLSIAWVMFERKVIAPSKKAGHSAYISQLICHFVQWANFIATTCELRVAAWIKFILLTACAFKERIESWSGRQRGERF